LTGETPGKAGQRAPSLQGSSLEIAQLVQPSEGWFHFRFDTDTAHHSDSECLVHRMPHQCRLADPRFSPHNNDRAATGTHPVKKAIRRCALAARTVQHVLPETG